MFYVHGERKGKHRSKMLDKEGRENVLLCRCIRKSTLNWQKGKIRAGNNFFAKNGISNI